MTLGAFFGWVGIHLEMQFWASNRKKYHLMCVNAQPPMGGMQNGNSVRMFTCCTQVFARLSADLNAQSVITNKISASELTRKLIKNVLLVGCVHIVNKHHLLTKFLLRGLLMVRCWLGVLCTHTHSLHLSDSLLLSHFRHFKRVLCSFLPSYFSLHLSLLWPQGWRRWGG